MLKKNTNLLVFSSYVLPRNRQQNKCTYASNDVKANSLSFLSQSYYSIVICYCYYCEHLNQDYLYECACTCSWTLGSAWCKLGLKWWLLCSCHEATKMTYYLLWFKVFRLPMKNLIRLKALCVLSQVLVLILNQTISIYFIYDLYIVQ